MIDLERMKDHPTHVNDTEVLELIQSLSEAKDLITYLKKTAYEHDCDKWLDKYFGEK